MSRTSKLSLFIAVMLLLQISLASGSAGPQLATAASAGPVALSLSPADDLMNVPLTADLKMTFDETVAKGLNSAAISIYESSTNNLVESISVSSSRVTIDSTQRIVTIDPQNNFVIKKNYYVLVDTGAFVNVSNGASYAGIYSANSWNFRSVEEVDTIRPSHTARLPVHQSTLNAVTTPVTITFDEAVYAVSGNILLTSTDDTRSVSVTSSSVQGSGTNQIIIQTPAALQPNTTYTVTVPSTVFQDAAGNYYNGTSWNFTTDIAPVNALAPLSPADNATSVPVNSPLRITFDKTVFARSNKYVEIRRVDNNATFQRIEAVDSRINVNGSVVTITPGLALEANTSYYVLIDAGAFTQADATQWYYGISGANIWNFTTDPGNETNAPYVTKLTPTNNGSVGSLNTKLELTFDEAVYPSSGTIEIRAVGSGALFRSISVTSERVTGGGSKTITIDPNKAVGAESAKAFVNNTRYYVTIGNRAFRDAAGNFYAGLSSSNQWSFTITQDSVKPTVTTLSPNNNATAVAENAKFTATFSEAVMKGTGAITIYRIGAGTPSIITTTFDVDSLDNRKIVIRPTQNLSQGASYFVYIDEDAVTDLVGNAFVGILNEYQWTFKTIGSDLTPPAISKLESNGSTIIMTYNEQLDSNKKPSPGSFYITVNGAQRTVTNTQVVGETVLLTLSSPIINGQLVKLNYSKPAIGLIQDISGNEAVSLSNNDVTNAPDSTLPRLIGGTALGSTITLSYSKDILSVNSNAYLQFTVNVGGTMYSPTSIISSGSLVMLTINGTIQGGQSVRVSYTPSSYPIKDVSGNNAAAVSNFDLSSGTDTAAPSLLSVSASGSQVTLKYNKSLNPLSVPSSGQYSVYVDNISRPVTQVRVSGDSVILTISPAVTTGQNVSVSYVAGSALLTDLTGNPAPSFNGMQSNGGTGSSGMMYGVSVKGSTLTMTYSESLNPSYIPPSLQFLVMVNDLAKVINKVAVSGSEVTLTLATPVAVNDRVTITYYSTSSGLRTNSGQMIASFSNISVLNSTSLLDSLTGDYEASDGGGVGLKPTTATTMSDVSPGGNSALRYTVQSDKIIVAYQTARASGMTSPRVAFKVPSTERAAIVAIPLLALETVYRQGGSPVFVVQHGDVTYELSLNALNYTAMSSMAGGSSATNHLLVEIDQGASSKTSGLSTMLGVSSAQVIAGPANFELSVLNGASEVPLTTFNGYLTRTIQTSSSVNASQSSVVWYDPQAGALSYVPTIITTTGGKTTATFKRKGNSAYAFVRNSSSFSDVTSHWAASAINTLTRKFIVEGRTTTKFAPQSAITRGEFATYIAKGLGLSGDRNAAAAYTDLNENTAMGAYIGAASTAGIVTGNTDGSFKPNNPITRQEMAVMMVRAAKAVDVTISLPSSAASYLTKYTDRGKISSYAQTDVAKAVSAGIMNGKTNTTMSPLANATRAEGAVMLMRLLQHIKFITP